MYFNFIIIIIIQQIINKMNSVYGMFYIKIILIYSLDIQPIIHIIYSVYSMVNIE
jgi:hypothetical protein